MILLVITIFVIAAVVFLLYLMWSSKSDNEYRQLRAKNRRLNKLIDLANEVVELLEGDFAEIEEFGTLSLTKSEIRSRKELIFKYTINRKENDE